MYWVLSYVLYKCLKSPKEACDIGLKMIIPTEVIQAGYDHIVNRGANIYTERYLLLESVYFLPLLKNYYIPLLLKLISALLGNSQRIYDL